LSFHRCTLHKSVLQTTQERQWRRETLTVSAKVEVRSSVFLAPITMRSSHLTFVFLYQLPIFFHRRIVYTNAFHVAQEKQRRRVSVCAKIDLQTYPNFRHSTNSSTQAVRSSHVIFVLRCHLLIFFHRPTLHTYHTHTMQERQRRRVTLTISAKVQVRSSVILAHWRCGIHI